MARNRQPAKLAKRGDQVYIEQQLTDLSTPGGQTDPIDLSGATVRFIMEGPDGSLVVNSEATVIEGDNGTVEYLFGDGELAQTGGHRAEWRVIDSPGEDYRWPPGPGNHLIIDIGTPIDTDRDPAEIDPKQDIDVGVLQAETAVIESLTPSTFAGVDIVSSSAGEAGIQTAVDNADGNEIWLMGGDYRWEGSLEAPSGTTIRTLGEVSGTVPADHNLTQYDAPHGGTVTAAITNADHTNGNSDIYIEGISIDMDNLGAPDSDEYTAGIWFYGFEDVTVENCRVENVRPSGPEREYGILFADGEQATLRECEAENCGYEGIGFRGGIADPLIENCHSHNNRIHSLQIAGWTGDQEGLHRPYNVTIRGGTYDDDLICHGIRNPENQSFRNRDHAILIEEVTGDEILLYENNYNITIKNVHCDVRMVPRQWGDRDGTIGQVTIDGLEHSGYNDSPITIEGEGNDPALRDITMRQISVQGVDPTNSALISVRNASPETSAADQIRMTNVSLADSSLMSEYLAHVDDGYDLKLTLDNGLNFRVAPTEGNNPDATGTLTPRAPPGGLSVGCWENSQAAVDWALENDLNHLYFPAGEHQGFTAEGVPALKITGAGADSTRFTGSVRFESSHHQIMDCGFESDCFIGRASTDTFGVKVRDCSVFGDNFIRFLDSTRRCLASGNYGTTDAAISFSSGSQDNVASGNTVPSITGNTSDNVTVGNLPP